MQFTVPASCGASEEKNGARTGFPPDPLDPGGSGRADDLLTRHSASIPVYRCFDSFGHHSPLRRWVAVSLRKAVKVEDNLSGESSFASNCLPARHLIERGSRFMQLYHATYWDSHSVPAGNLNSDFEKVC